MEATRRRPVPGDAPGERFRFWAALAGAVPLLAGGVVLLGWALDVAALKSVVPGLTAMNPLTALCFLLGGLSLWLQNSALPSRSRRYLAQLCGLLVALAGLLVLLRYVLGWPITLDQLAFQTKLGLNRMAPNTALNFLLIGLALLVLDVEIRRGFRPAQVLTLVAGLIALVALIGYAYGIQPLYNVPSYIAMALNTAAAFLGLALGILLARAESGPMAVVASDTAGGVMARRLIPAALLIPLLLGWLRLAAQRAGLLTLESGLTLFAVAMVVLFAAVIWWSARALYAADLQRRQAAQALRRYAEDLQRSNQDLEQFAYVASHDLQEPLRKIRSFGDLLQQEYGTLLTGEAADYLARMRNAAQRMQELIDDLLTFARMTTRGLPLAPVDLNSVVAQVVSDLETRLAETGGGSRSALCRPSRRTRSRCASSCRTCWAMP